MKRIDLPLVLFCAFASVLAAACFAQGAWPSGIAAAVVASLNAAMIVLAARQRP